MTFRILGLLLLLTVPSAADPNQVRRWTGTNGKSFEGAYIGVDKSTGKLAILSSEGHIFHIAPENLSKKDREWLEAAQNPGRRDSPPAAAGKEPAGDPAKFLPDPPLDRTTLPVLNQADYGSKAMDCVPSSFCNFLLWWDQVGYLPIDRRGDFDRKAEYIHSRVARYFGTRNNSGTSMRHAEEGIRKYFEKDLADLATFRIRTDRDCSAENIRRYATGPNAILLEVSYYLGDDYEGSHVVALSHVDADDNLVFVTWGSRLRGKLKPIEAPVRLPDGTPAPTLKNYELVIQNRGDLSEWARTNEVRFKIIPRFHDGIMVISPYRYKEAGQPAPPPADPLMEQAPGE